MRADQFVAPLRIPGVRWLMTTSVVARLPVAMTGLAIVLRITRGGGSYSAAGGVTAAYVIGGALLGPTLGRLVDRYGRDVVLVVAALCNALGVLVLSRISVRETTTMLGVALLAGLSTPPVAACVRSLWPVLVEGDQLGGLYAIDSTLQELTFVVGPALVALLGTVADSSVPLIASAALGLLGTVALALHPAIRLKRGLPHEPRVRVTSLALMVLVATGLLLVLGCGIVQLGVIGYCTEHHAAAQSGLMLAVWSIGSIVGGVIVGGRVNAAAESGYVLALAGAAAGSLLLAASVGVDMMYPLAFIAGLSVVPALGCLYSLGSKIAPARGAVEAFSWISSGTQTGIAGGAAVGGYLVQQSGTTLTFGVAAGIIAAAALTAFLGKGTFSRHPG